VTSIAVTPTEQPDKGSIDLALMAREGRRLPNGEIRHRCTKPELHHNGDARPSARWNPAKGVFLCDVCGDRGGWKEMMSRLGKDQSPVSHQARREEKRAARIVTTYDYVRPDDSMIFQVVRMSDKSFRQRRPDPEKPDNWIWDMSGIERIPYRLPELITALPSAPVFVTEGEKDVDNLIGLGAVATTNPGGAGKWRAEYSEYLKDRSVVILADQDATGRRHAGQVAASVSRVAASVKVIESYPGLESAEKADVSDWISTGRTLDDLYALVDRTPAWTGISDPIDAPEPDAFPLIFHTAAEIRDMTPPQVEWVVRGIAASHAITDLSAMAKVGKTTFITGMIGSITRGSSFLGSPVRQGTVVYLSEERPSVFRGPLGRAGLLDSADLHVLFRQDANMTPWPDIVTTAVEKAASVGAVLLVIDTSPAWAGLAGDTENDAGSALQAMAPLQAAAATGLAVVVVRHDRKGGGELGESGRGSSAFAGAADILLGLRRANTEGHPTRRELLGVGRFDDIPAEIVLELRDGEWLALGDAINVERAGAKSHLLDTLPGPNEPWAMETDVVKALGPPAKRSTARRALDELIAEGQVEKGERVAGKTGMAHGYRLTSDQPNVTRPDPLNTLVSDSPGSNGGDQGVSRRGLNPTVHRPTDVDPESAMEELMSE